MPPKCSLSFEGEEEENAWTPFPLPSLPIIPLPQLPFLLDKLSVLPLLVLSRRLISVRSDPFNCLPLPPERAASCSLSFYLINLARLIIFRVGVPTVCQFGELLCPTPFSKSACLSGSPADPMPAKKCQRVCVCLLRSDSVHIPHFSTVQPK